MTKFDSIIDCTLSGSVAEGSGAVTTLHGVCNVTCVSDIVTQSPSVVNAEVAEYAVMMRYTSEEPGLLARVILMTSPICAVSGRENRKKNFTKIGRRCKGNIKAENNHLLMRF